MPNSILNNKIKVWDLPVRLFHWALVLLIALQGVTGEAEGRGFFLHVFFGYLILFLVLFRLLWGFGGSDYAKFSNFLRPWAVVKNYAFELMKFRPPRFIGHNPLGGWMIVLLLLGIAIQVITGLLARSDEAFGPWTSLLSANVGESISEFHEAFFIVLLSLIVIHICGVITDWILTRDNIIKAMFTGQKELSEDGTPLSAKQVQVPVKNLIFILFIASIMTVALSPAEFAPASGQAGKSYRQEVEESEERESSVETGKSEENEKLSADEINRRLEGLGYTQIGEIEFEGEKVEVKAINPQGRNVELYLDPTTGQITREH